MSDPDDHPRASVAVGDVAAVSHLLGGPATDLVVNRRDARGRTVLHDAAERGTPAMLILLLDAGARPWIEDAGGRTPADLARESASAAFADPLRAEVLSLLTEVRFGDDGLRDAVAALDAGEVERLRGLLAADRWLVRRRAAGGDAITRGYFTRPMLLHFVAGNPGRTPRMPPRVLDATAAILDAGAEVDAATEGGACHTTLALVASSGPAHEDGVVEPLLELLVDRGADPSRGLEAAAMHRHTATVRLLLRLGAGHSLISAAALGDLPALRRLLAGAATREALHRAAWSSTVNGQPEALALLLDAGVDLDARLPRPFDPLLLHEAAWHGHRAVVDLLLARGADPTLRDTQYDGIPAGWASHGGHPELAERLEAAARAWVEKRRDT